MNAALRRRMLRRRVMLGIVSVLEVFGLLGSDEPLALPHLAGSCERTRHHRQLPGGEDEVTVLDSRDVCGHRRSHLRNRQPELGEPVLDRAHATGRFR